MSNYVSIFWTDPSYDIETTPLLVDRAAFLQPPRLFNGRLTTTKKRLASGLFRYLDDPVLAPRLEASPAVVTELVPEQYITLVAFDQRLPFVQLTGMTIIGPGIKIIGPSTGRFVVGAAKSYRLRLETNRVGGIIGSVHWHFAHQPDVVMQISAIDTALWPFRPTFPVTEHWQWSTAIIETKSREQRLSNATHPRMKFTYSHQLDSPRVNDAILRIAALSKAVIQVPWWLDAIHPVDVAKGALKIAISVVGHRFGTQAILFHSEFEYELVQISVVTDEAVFVANPIKFNHSNATFIPLLSCFAIQHASVDRVGYYNRNQITFEVHKPLAPQAIGPEATWQTTYLGYPVIDRYKKGRKLKIGHHWDSKTTVTNQFIPHRTREIHQYSAAIELIEQDWRDLQRRLMPLKGRLNPVWLVDYQQSIVLARPCPYNRLSILPIGFNDYLSDGKHLWLRWENTVEMVFATPAGYDDHGNEVLLIDSPNSTEIQPEQLQQGNIIRLMRLGKDTWKFTHNKGITSIPLTLFEIKTNEHGE